LQVLKFPILLYAPANKWLLKNTTIGSGLQYSWLYGDGGKSTATSPTHLYTTSGTYHPTLFVADENNCKDTASSSLIVSLPIAKFAMSDSFATCPPLSVKFENKSSNYADYTWNFGDGSTSVVDTPTHLYTYPGIYNVKLILHGNGTCADSAFKK